MPEPTVPSPFYRTLVQTFVATKQATKVTAADTETATHWDVKNGAAEATAQKTKLVGLETESRTNWKAVSAKGGGMGFDEFVRGSAVVPVGLKALPVKTAAPAASAKAVSQKTEVTGAQTLTKTAWKVDDDGADRKMTATAQDSKLESFDTRTRTRWVLNEKLESLDALKGLLGE